MPRQKKLSYFYPPNLVTWPPRTRRSIRLENEAARSRAGAPPISSSPSQIKRRKPVHWIARILLAHDPGSIEDLRIERNDYYPAALPISEERWMKIVEAAKSGDPDRLAWAQRALYSNKSAHFVKKSIK